ncbi:unnamed protein product [marine sediment metagenome]|uniref:Uncharacterized protein n=1 Tax=marine sediment metagenome TaxID=412755 RepID=X1E3S2_9ZZZZ
MTNQYSPEVLALRDRVRLGNYKLFRAWQQIKELAHDSEQWSQQIDRWHDATEKLSLLCSELKLKGYADCLYMENGKRTKSCLSNPDGFFCQVCSSIYPYWELELMSLPGPKARQTKGGEDQLEFLRKLGEVKE